MLRPAYIVPPDHPGTQPLHQVTATQAQITAADRQYDTALKVFRCYSQVLEAIRQQILAAIDPTYYNVLEDNTFGYAGVTIIAFLKHLDTTYGATLTADDIELNRAEAWTPDVTLENLWVHIKHHCLRAIATAGGEPLSDSTVMHFILLALELAGVYTRCICTWHDWGDSDCNWTNFRPHFVHGDNKECLCLLVATTAGYHGAHATIYSLPGDTGVVAATWLHLQIKTIRFP